jgi:prepilin-type processing-associated H-X9-DG protein/prepilin-type N-terminal cleavage/methylation domain-containing protein
MTTGISVRQKRNVAFSLVELLVVISIIAVLAVIVNSVMVASKRAGYAASCLSNTTQINKAIQLYSADSNDFFPPISDKPWPLTYDNSVLTWMDSLRPYLKVLLSCPEAPKIEAKAAGYAINAELSKGDWATHTFVPRQASEVEFSSSTILLLDAPAGFVAIVSVSEANWESFGKFTNVADQYTEDRRAALSRHPGGLNLSFCDGHAKIFPYTSIQRDNIGKSPSFSLGSPRQSITSSP